MCLVGTVRFIGELFKLKMIMEAIIHTCMVKLMKDECEESLECLCKLVSMVEKDLDIEARVRWPGSPSGVAGHQIHFSVLIEKN